MPRDDAGEKGNQGDTELALEVPPEEVGERGVAGFPLLHLLPHRKRMRGVPDAGDQSKRRAQRA